MSDQTPVPEPVPAPAAAPVSTPVPAPYASAYPVPPPGGDLPAGPPTDEDVARARRFRRAAVKHVLQDAAAIVGGMAVLGAVCGVIWAFVVTPDQLIRFKDGIGQNELELSRTFAVDGWFAVIASVAGFAAGMVFGFKRTRDLVATVLLVLVGCVAAALIMWGVGHLIGPNDPTAVLKDAKVGDTADVPLDRPALAFFLAWPVSALAGLLIPLLSGND